MIASKVKQYNFLRLDEWMDRQADGQTDTGGY